MSAREKALVASVSKGDLALLAEALQLLLRERYIAHRMATSVAITRGEREPEIHEFGLVDILRLSRQIADLEPEKTGEKSTGNELALLSPTSYSGSVLWRFSGARSIDPARDRRNRAAR
jgi:hypothetical protein